MQCIIGEEITVPVGGPYRSGDRTGRGTVPVGGPYRSGDRTGRGTVPVGGPMPKEELYLYGFGKKKLKQMFSFLSVSLSPSLLHVGKFLPTHLRGVLQHVRTTSFSLSCFFRPF